MRILVHDYAGHPFQVQLSRELARRGHEVFHLYAGYNNTPKGNLSINNSDPGRFHLEGIFTKQPLEKYSFIKRWLQELEYGKLLADRIASLRPEVVLSANTPLDSQKKAIKQCQEMDIKFIFWLQDVLGLAAYHLLKTKIPVIGSWIGKYHIKIERRMLCESHRVVLIADEFQSIVEGWGVASDRLCVIPNWAPLDEMPVRPKVNKWSVAQGISEKYCILYTGGLGLKHNPNLLLQLSLHFRDNDRVRIIVISEGPGTDWLETEKERHLLSNLILLGFQPFNRIPEVLASGDVLVAILNPEAGDFSVPSKVLTYLCAERPLLLAVPSNNLAARIVAQNNAGYVVSPSEIEAFINRAETLLKSVNLRMEFASNARAYAEHNFNIQNIGCSFEELISG